MNYRAIGEWLESDYRVTAPGWARKLFHCRMEATSLVTGDPLVLEYEAANTVTAGRLGRPEVVAEAERNALAILHAMIDEAIAGRGYIRKVTMADCLRVTLSHMIEGWVEHGGVSGTWPRELEASLTAGNQKYREIIDACRRIGAGPSREHDAWGWVVPIEPVRVPVEANLIPPGI